ncbi:MAG: Tim44 domain-containing protein [Sphingopyxis sp.]|nr:Tim44 domain-containing protein [Sphingopyxis sp.]
MISIVLLAMVAAFLGLRLYSVLGKRTGHEQEPVLPRAEERSLPGASRVPDLGEATQTSDAPAAVPGTVYEPAAEVGVRAVLAADRSFDAGRFINGAEAAYRMILEAFWAGDRDTLRDLCDADTYAAFDLAIAAREERGETLDNRLVRIDSARIAAADVTRGVARITVAFTADIVAVTRGKDNGVVAGSMSDAVETHDRWTFVRDISSNDPNWKLDETESA